MGDSPYRNLLYQKKDAVKLNLCEGRQTHIRSIEIVFGINLFVYSSEGFHVLDKTSGFCLAGNTNLYNKLLRKTLRKKSMLPQFMRFLPYTIILCFFYAFINLVEKLFYRNCGTILKFSVLRPV